MAENKKLPNDAETKSTVLYETTYWWQILLVAGFFVLLYAGRRILNL